MPLGKQNIASMQSEMKADFTHHIKGLFGDDTFQVPPNATRSVYVQGIPPDATEREVSRK